MKIVPAETAVEKGEGGVAGEEGEVRVVRLAVKVGLPIHT